MPTYKIHLQDGSDAGEAGVRRLPCDQTPAPAATATGCASCSSGLDDAVAAAASSV
jgi:hypothetical protein